MASSDSYSEVGTKLYRGHLLTPRPAGGSQSSKLHPESQPWGHSNTGPARWPGAMMPLNSQQFKLAIYYQWQFHIKAFIIPAVVLNVQI